MKLYREIYAKENTEKYIWGNIKKQTYGEEHLNEQTKKYMERYMK